MLTPEFKAGAASLLKLARRRTTLLCAEGLFWRCHRRLVSDFLSANGVTVEHIMPNGDLRPHALTEGVAVDSGQVSYPGELRR
jgi:uncharacterized protein (DUF488 family)